MIYLASPYSHPDPVVRIERFIAARDFLSLHIPHTVLYSPIVHCHPVAEAHNLRGDFETWKNYNLHILRLCDALWVLTLDGWEKSEGVQEEITFAQLCGLPIQYTLPLFGASNADY